MAHHVDLKAIENYIRTKQYPEEIRDKGQKANFRRATKNFSLQNGIFCKDGRMVITETGAQRQIISDLHQGIGEDIKAVALAAHYGRSSTYQKVIDRFYWYTIYDDVDEFIKNCLRCQKQSTMPKGTENKLHCIPVPSEVMKQIGVDLCNLPEVDGLKHVVIAIDYFSKWSEAKPLRDKGAPSVATFLYELICRHGCFSIQINDQGREFVNELSNHLHTMTGVEQRITSAYHPQANGLVERQNRTIKNSLVKVLDENPTQWPHVLDGVLFAHRSSKHSSTKYTPFFLLYNRHPVLPVDIKYDTSAVADDTDDNDKQFDEETFRAILATAGNMRTLVHEKVALNIIEAQKSQKKQYDRRHASSVTMKVGDLVLLKNNKKADRKGGKFKYSWLGPYVINSLSKKGIATLQTSNGVILKKKYNIANLKPCTLPAENDVSLDEKVSDVDISPISPNVGINHATSIIPDEKISNVEVSPIPPSLCTDYNLWNKLPTEIVTEILTGAVKSSRNVAETFHSVEHTCRRFQDIIQPKMDSLLPRIYIPPLFTGDLMNLSARSGTIKVSVRKLAMICGQSSGVIMDIQDIIGDKKWKSAWLVLSEKKHSWFLVDRCFWKPKNPIKIIDIEDTVVPEEEEGNFWLKNATYNLNGSDKLILISPSEWLNDSIMDAAQKLICKQLGNGAEYQSVLYAQKHFHAVDNEHVQLLHDGSQHWFSTYCTGGTVYVCDSLKTYLNRISKKSVQALYRNCVDSMGHLAISFLPVQQQIDADRHNCGVFAIAFAAEILDGKSPANVNFDVAKMRDHLITCLEKQQLSPFPKKNGEKIISCTV